MNAYHFLEESMRSGAGAEPPWLRGEINTQELAVARDGAWDAAREVVKTAAYAVARDAASAVAWAAARAKYRGWVNDALLAALEEQK